MTPYGKSFLIIAFVCFGIACKKTIIRNEDKQIRFDFPPVGTNGQTWITYGNLNIYKFNIDYYAGLDSVFLAVWAWVPKTGNKGTIELYNATDSVTIPGSLIEVTTSTEPRLYQSGNIVKNFPRKEITLALRLKGDMNGELVQFNKSTLYLYR